MSARNYTFMSVMLNLFKILLEIKRLWTFGVPRWLSWLSIDSWFWLRSWSRGSWLQTPHQALCWQQWLHKISAGKKKMFIEWMNEWLNQFMSIHFNWEGKSSSLINMMSIFPSGEHISSPTGGEFGFWNQHDSDANLANPGNNTIFGQYQMWLWNNESDELILKRTSKENIPKWIIRINLYMSKVTILKRTAFAWMQTTEYVSYLKIFHNLVGNLTIKNIFYLQLETD